MIKEILAACDYSFFAEAALVMFASLFVIITIRTFVGSSKESAKNSRMALTEQPENLTHE